MMFRSLFYVAPVLALDQQYKELLQRASSELSSGTLKSLEENLAQKGGCQKVIAAEVKDKHYFEDDDRVKEWKDKFNFKRKVKNDVKISKWCADKLTANDWKDADFKDGACKTVEKAKKECSKSLKATCNFVRSTTRKLFKKALKGSRKVRKELAFTSKRDPLKTKVNAFKCKKYKGVKNDDLKAASFGELQTHFDDIYKEIMALKGVVDTQVAAKDAKKDARKAALKKADDDHEKCEDKAEADKEAAKLAAETKKDNTIKTVTESTDADTLKKTKKDAATDLYKSEKSAAEKQKVVDDKKCDADRKAAKAKAEADFKA